MPNGCVGIFFCMCKLSNRKYKNVNNVLLLSWKMTVMSGYNHHVMQGHFRLNSPKTVPGRLNICFHGDESIESYLSCGCWCIRVSLKGVRPTFTFCEELRRVCWVKQSFISWIAWSCWRREPLQANQHVSNLFNAEVNELYDCSFIKQMLLLIDRLIYK